MERGSVKPKATNVSNMQTKQAETKQRKPREAMDVSESVETKPKEVQGRGKSQRKSAKDVKKIEETKASEEPAKMSRNAKAAKEEKQSLKKEDKQKVT